MKRVNLDESVERGVNVNMSPLIDCVFLLLIFFIVTTVFVEETGVEIRKPRAASAETLETQSLMLALTADGKVMFADREIGMRGVRGVVARQLRERDVPVIILADRDARTAPLVELIDACKLAGARKVSVATTREE